MPHPANVGRLQSAVLWQATGYDGYGNVAVGDPVEIKVRWNTTRSEVVDSQGNKVSLDAQVVVGEKIAIGSHMWLGTLVDWFATDQPNSSGRQDKEVMEVVKYSETPDIRNRAVYRTVGLMRLHGKPARPSV